MNSQKAKLIRKVSEKLGLNYRIQKKIYKSLSENDKKIYISDLKINLENYEEAKKDFINLN